MTPLNQLSEVFSEELLIWDLVGEMVVYRFLDLVVVGLWLWVLDEDIIGGLYFIRLWFY